MDNAVSREGAQLLRLMVARIRRPLTVCPFPKLVCRTRISLMLEKIAGRFVIHFSRYARIQSSLKTEKFIAVRRHCLTDRPETISVQQC